MKSTGYRFLDQFQSVRQPQIIIQEHELVNKPQISLIVRYFIQEPGLILLIKLAGCKRCSLITEADAPTRIV